MKRFYGLLIGWLLWGVLKSFSQVLPSEKLFFMSDKVRYEQGDTAWVEGRVMRSDNDTTFVPYGRYVYVELADERDTVLVRQKLVCDSIGNFITRVPIDYWLPGYYYLRAYSKVMANFAPETLPVFPIQVGEGTETDGKTFDLQCDFYPEGGHLVNGFPQNIGVKFADESGNPVQLTYRLMTSQGDTLVTQTTSVNGWQVFRFTPMDGIRYHLETDCRGEHYTWLLPECKPIPTLQTTVHRNRLICKVLDPKENFKRGKLYIYHQSLGLLMLPYKKKDFVMLLNDGLSSGLISIFLANAKGEFVAQSSKWLNRYRPMEFQLLKKDYHSGGLLEGQWTEALDSASSVFVRFIPKEYPYYVPRTSVMCHYDSDLISDETFPTHHTGKADTEGWLYSARFKRINVPEALDMGILYTKDKEVVMEMQGFAKTKRGKKLRNGSLVAFRESDQQVYDVKLDEQGRFDMFLDDFGTDETFFVQAYNRKGKAGIYEYEFYNDTLPGMYNWNRVNKKERERFTVEIGDMAVKNFGVNKMNYLPEVVVKARTYKKQQKSTKQFYSTHYLDTEQLERRSFTSFRHLVESFHAYLYWEEGGMTTDEGVFEASDRYALYSRRGASTLEGAQVKILLDGILITPEQAAYLDMSTIGAVEYLSPSEAVAVVPFAISGVLLLDTKRALGIDEVASKGIVYVPPMGLSNLNMRKLNGDEIKVPSSPGEYTLLIDLISQTQGIHSFEYDIHVK